jgi:hypothetical protein
MATSDMEKNGVKLTQKTKIMLGAYPGREVRMKTPQGDAWGRIYIANGRLYEAMAS